MCPVLVVLTMSVYGICAATELPLPPLSAEEQYLVLLQQPAAGLKWLAESWEQVTDPASHRYRDFVPRSEIVRRLSPPPPTQRAVQRWLHARGWGVLQHYGDAMLVVCCRIGSLAATSQVFHSDDLAAPEEVVAVVAASSQNTDFLHNH